MADDTVYESSAGGGYGDGTTSGQTGQNPLPVNTLDDREFPLSLAEQEDAEETYHPNPELPQMMTNNASQDGEFHNMVNEPRGNSLAGMPNSPQATVIQNPDLPMSAERQQEVGQAVLDGQAEATFENNGNDMPGQEVG